MITTRFCKRFGRPLVAAPVFTWPAAPLLLALILALAVGAPAARAVVLEGVGHATVVNGDLDRARAQAREAALRDLALQYEASVSTRDTMENGVLTESRTELAAQARARNVQVVDEQRSGNRLRLVVRADVSDGQGSCQAGNAYRLKKRVAVLGFPLVQPDQARVGQIGDVNTALPEQIQARLRASQGLQVLSATQSGLFEDPVDAPTRQLSSNQLTNVVALARELGAQFVVAGVVRDVGISDPAAWNTSLWAGLKRGIGASDRSRRFVVDLMVFDGLSGSPVYQERFRAAGDWNAEPGSSTGFASAGFLKTDYGRAVSGAVDRMASAIGAALACQPFMTRVVRVDNRSITLASGATAGLRPGDELHLYRSARHWDALDQAPELSDAGATVTLNSVHPDVSSGTLTQGGPELNVQRDDMAIIW